MIDMTRDVTLILHNIRSAHNVGAIFRTAEGFGVRRLVLSGYTPYPDLSLMSQPDPRLPHIREKLTAQIHKTALGAEAMVPFVRYGALEDWLAANQQGERLPLLALEQSPQSVMLPNFAPPEQFALLLGEEVRGIDEATLAVCDAVVEIPMVGQKESFNVSVAAGIAMYGLMINK